jgi:hypothetical protein
MIVDCFLFYNELDMLTLHLEELYNVVDKFVLVESTTTFVGNVKPLYFNENKDKYSKYLDKIVHVIVEDTPKSNNPWFSEKFQRNAIDRGLSQLNLKHGDIIIIGDVDEISDSETIANISKEGLHRPMSLEMDFYYYNFNCRNVEKWYSTKVIPYTIYKQYPDPDNLRRSRCDTFKNGGWHLSYFGTPEFISNKLSNFSHQEYNNNDHNDVEIIKTRMDNSDDLFGRHDSKFEKVESDYLPKNYRLIS